MGTMKNAMSGGKGKVSRYTQKFKQSYNRFVKIGDNDDEKDQEIIKLKKMEEWGRMRSIYKFLKFQKNKYIGSNGTEITALEKMEENISRTKDKDGYESAINCFKQSESYILLEGDKCIPEEDYIKGDTEAPDASDDAVIDEASASVVSGTDEAQDNAVIDEASNNNDTPFESSSQATTADVVSDDNSIASENDNNDTTNQKPSDNDVIAEASENDNTPFESASEVSDDTEAPAPVAEAPAPEAAADVPSAIDVQPRTDDADSNAEEMKADADAEAMKADTNVPADAEKQNGGRSKRRQKSSRRRGKSMKSKKGRRTRRR
jgi:hypothetical protein